MIRQTVILLFILLSVGLGALPVQAGLPPLTWLVGKHKHIRISLQLEGFVRPEWMTNRGDYNGAVEDSDFYVASRFRVSGEIEYRRQVGFRITLQDARYWGHGLSQDGKIRFTPDTDQFTREVFLGLHLFEAFLYLQWPDANIRFEAGRMKIVYGNNFLFGDPGFLPPGQSFDGIRLRWQPGSFRLDLMWLLIRESITANRPDCVGNCFWEGDHIAGVYAHKKWGRHETDLYAYYYQRAPRIQTLQDSSQLAFLGARYFFQNRLIRALLEAQLQVGRYRDQDLLTGAGVVRFRFTIPVPTRPYLELQGMFATGDGDPSDTSNNNFLPLFNNRRGFYGMVNLYGLSNIIQPMVRAGFNPHSRIAVYADVRYTWKFHEKGTMVAGGSHNPVLFDLTGQDGREVGTEINVRVRYTPFPGITFDLTGGMFLPAKELHVRDGQDQITKTFGKDPAFMVFLALWWKW